MKKQIVIAAFGSACTSVFAQSVQIYGLLDAGVNHVTGLANGSSTQLVSGIMEGSRLGLRGQEDLGGGYRAIFTMESRLEADTGGLSNRPPSGTQVPDRWSRAELLGLPAALQPVVSGVAASLGSTVGTNLAGNFWDRQIFVGLVTPVGAVLAGRQYTPAYEVSAAFDTLGTQSSLAAGQVGAAPATVDIRVSNALAYRIQRGGLTASVMAAAAEGSATTGRLLGAMAIQRSDAFSVGVGYNTRENERGEKSLTSLVVGASVGAGPGTLHALYADVQDDHPSNLSSIGASLAPVVGAPTASAVQNAYSRALRQDMRILHGGYRFTRSVHTVYVAYTAADDRTAADADVSSYGVAYSYALSKRSDLNVVLAQFNNKGLAQSAPGGGGFVGGFTASAGTDSRNLALGLRHRF
jgi:predicted porin